jgi:hypothetical protein
MTSATSDLTIVPKAAPIMIPTAMSTTFPRIANSLNSLNIFPLLSDYSETYLRLLKNEAKEVFDFRAFQQPQSQA